MPSLTTVMYHFGLSFSSRSFSVFVAQLHFGMKFKPETRVDQGLRESGTSFKAQLETFHCVQYMYLCELLEACLLRRCVSACVFTVQLAMFSVTLKNYSETLKVIQASLKDLALVFYASANDSRGRRHYVFVCPSGVQTYVHTSGPLSLDISRTL